MAITYPLTLPSAPAPRNVEWSPFSAVARFGSPFTLQQQVQSHQGQLWQVKFQLPPMREPDAEDWLATLLSLNGMQGTFYFGDSILKAPRGTALGTPLVDGPGQFGQTLIVDGYPVNSNGLLLPGDWFQLGVGSVVWSGVPSWATDLEIAEKTATDVTIHFTVNAPGGGGTLDWGMEHLFGQEVIAAGENSVIITHNLGTGGTKRLHKVLKVVNSDATGKAVIEFFPRLREIPADNEPLVLTNCKGTFRLRDNVMDWAIPVNRLFYFEIEAVESF